MTMHNPPRPGETLRDDVLSALDSSVTAAVPKSRMLKVTRCVAAAFAAASLSRTAMAVRLWNWT